MYFCIYYGVNILVLVLDSGHHPLPGNGSRGGVGLCQDFHGGASGENWDVGKDIVAIEGARCVVTSFPPFIPDGACVYAEELEEMGYDILTA